MFRDFISHKPNSRFQAEANRYHLYVSYACPWANRALITRYLKGLTAIITVSVVHWHMDDKGWRFNDDKSAKTDENGTVDDLYDFSRLSQLYYKANPDYSGRFTVPVLWDKKLKTIVNNESSEILRMLNTEFNSLVGEKEAKIDLYPEELRESIDDLNSWVYDTVNNGVYKTGFATKQEVYDEEVVKVFASLERIEKILEKSKYLVGNVLTEADVRLYVTLIRFDPVYHQHFKCNIKMLRHDYPNIHKWMRELYWGNEAFSKTTNFDHIKKHYTKSHVDINPHGITPLGPVPNILPL